MKEILDDPSIDEEERIRRLALIMVKDPHSMAIVVAAQAVMLKQMDDIIAGLTGVVEKLVRRK